MYIMVVVGIILVVICCCGQVNMKTLCLDIRGPKQRNIWWIDCA